MDTTDPVELVEKLDPEEIRNRLLDLYNQQNALRVLLRAAVARQRKQGRRRATPDREVADAAS
jgi:hypothetical protein